MLDVCLPAVIAPSTLPNGAVSYSVCRLADPHPRSRPRYFGLSFTSSQYQNTVESAYGLLPRPPQPPAARFKRLYRK